MRKLDRAVAAAVLAVLALVSCAPGSVEPPAATTTTTSLAGTSGLREVFVGGAIGALWADKPDTLAPGEDIDSSNYPSGSVISARRIGVNLDGLQSAVGRPITLCVTLVDGPTGGPLGAEQCRTVPTASQLSAFGGFKAEFTPGTFDTFSTPLLAGAHTYTLKARLVDYATLCPMEQCYAASFFGSRINW